MPTRHSTYMVLHMPAGSNNDVFVLRSCFNFCSSAHLVMAGMFAQGPIVLHDILGLQKSLVENLNHLLFGFAFDQY